MLLITLAQETAAAKPWWQYVVEQAFGLTILFIFVIALMSVLVKQWRKDKCLKLLHGFHVSVVNTKGHAAWGDLTVYSSGLELTFDAPYRNRHGLTKTSVLIYEAQMPECVAICRSTAGLSRKAQRKRSRQIRRSFRPGPLRRTWRWAQNLVNTFRDAFSKSLSAFVGQMSKSKQNSVVSQQSKGVVEIGDTLLEAAGNAYEPILERHVGQPVVLELQPPAGEGPSQSVELPGYLVDYTDKYLAVFNVEQNGLGQQTLTVTHHHQGPGYELTLDQGRLTVTCQGPEFLALHSIRGESLYAEPGLVLPPGAAIDLAVPNTTSVQVVLEPTRRIDIVCPRSHATIPYRGQYIDAHNRTNPQKEHGIPPEAKG